MWRETPIHEMTQFLCSEAILADIACKLITYKTINMHRRKKTREAQSHVLDLWSQFEDGLTEAKTLLLESTKFTAF